MELRTKFEIGDVTDQGTVREIGVLVVPGRVVIYYTMDVTGKMVSERELAHICDHDLVDRERAKCRRDARAFTWIACPQCGEAVRS